MPSDDRIALARAALARPMAEFRAEVEGALDLACSYLVGHAATDTVRAEHAAAALGRFAAGRIDPLRVAALFPPPGRGDRASILAMERAVEVLREVVVRGDDLFVTAVVPDRPLGATIDAGLARAGRAFGAIMLAELVRAGAYRAEEHDRLLDPAGFRDWNRVERRFAPPLIVALRGADLHAGALTDFADGRARLVLVVIEATAPAPLVRCVTPGTFVMQTVDGDGLDLVASCDGPAIAALVPEGCATFVHDPRAGKEPWQRLTIGTVGATAPRPIGGMSAWQMAEDQRLLGDLARPPFTIPGQPTDREPVLGADQAIDRVTDWLLGQAGLRDGA